MLVTELRNLKSQTEGQVAVAIAEASEARMVNRRLKKQNELLLTQIRTLVDDARRQESEAAIAAAADPDASGPPPPSTNSATATADESSESTVAYTLSEADLAVLNGRPPPSSSSSRTPPRKQPSRRSTRASQAAQGDNDDYRARLIAFLDAKDPDLLPQVDDMLESYRGVEQSLFESLELKYSLMEMATSMARKAQQDG